MDTLIYFSLSYGPEKFSKNLVGFSKYFSDKLQNTLPFLENVTIVLFVLLHFFEDTINIIRKMNTSWVHFTTPAPNARNLKTFNVENMHSEGKNVKN